MKVVVLGAGPVGCIAKRRLNLVNINGNLFDSMSYDEIHKRTFNHGAHYLWKPIEGFSVKRCRIITTVDGDQAVEESVRRYKTKVGRYEEGRDWSRQFKPKSKGYRIISFPDVVINHHHKAKRIDVVNKTVTFANGTEDHFDVIISTIPLNILVQISGMVDRPQSVFEYREIYVYETPSMRCKNEDMVVDYDSSPTESVYRRTYRDGKCHAESLKKFDKPDAILTPGKIWTNEETREWVERLKSYNIHCFGRFGTWEEDELLHQACEKVQNFVEGL